MAHPLADYGRYGSVGIEFVLTIGIMGALGQWLDHKFWGGHGYGLGIFFILGVAVAFRNLVRTAERMQRDIERAEAHDPTAGRWTVDPSWLHEDRDSGPGPVDPEAHSDADKAPESNRGDPEARR